MKPDSARLKAADVVVGVLILGLAASFRFVDLGKAPLWMDEVFSYLVSRLPLRDILLDEIDNHPPLFYAVQHLWTGLYDRLDGVRFPAALAGALTVLVVLGWVGRLYSIRAALISAALVALSTGHIYYSQDARMYTLSTFGLALALWGLNGLAERSRALRAAALYIIGAAIAVYSHATSLVFLLAANIGFALAVAATFRERPSIPIVLQWLAANVTLAVVSLPWLLSLSSAAGSFPGLDRVSASLAPWLFRNAVGFPGLPSPLRKAADLAFVAIALVGAVSAMRTGKKTFAILNLSVLILFPALLVGANEYKAILANRVFLPCILPLAALTGAALTSSRVNWLRTSAVAVLVGLSLASALVEHGRRTKFEDVPAGLAFAGENGFTDAPVLSCQYFTAGSVWAARPNERNFFLLDHSVFLFKPDFWKVATMSMAAFRKASADEVDKRLGGGYLLPAGLDGVLNGATKLVLVRARYEKECLNEVTEQAARRGLTLQNSREFENPVGILETGVTAVDLFASP